MNFTAESMNLLFFLMPGFLASALFRCIIQRNQNDKFNQFFEILTFSLIIFVLVEMCGKWCPVVTVQENGKEYLYEFTGNYSSLLWILLWSLVVPTGIGAMLYHDLHMVLLRKIGVTRSTSRRSAWGDTFKNNNRFILIHFNDGRRMVGHPMYYSEAEKDQYIYLYKPSWVVDKKYDDIPCHGVLVSGERIHWIEFLLE